MRSQILVGHFQRGNPLGGAGGNHQDVNSPQLRNHQVNNTLDVTAARHIGGRYHSPAAQGADFRGRLRHFPAPAADRRHIGPCLRKTQGDRPAQPARAAKHQCPLAF